MAYEGVGGRIRERLLALKYVRDDGEPNVQPFCWDHRFDKTNVHNWLGNHNVPTKDVIRLCVALKCSVEWLLTGKERAIPKAQPASGRRVRTPRALLLGLTVGAGLMWPSGSVPAHGGTIQLAEIINEIRLLGSWRRYLRISGYLPSGMAYA